MTDKTAVTDISEEVVKELAFNVETLRASATDWASIPKVLRQLRSDLTAANERAEKAEADLELKAWRETFKRLVADLHQAVLDMHVIAEDAKRVGEENASLQAQLETARQDAFEEASTCLSRTAQSMERGLTDLLTPTARAIQQAGIDAHDNAARLVRALRASPSTPDAQRKRDLALVDFALNMFPGDYSVQDILDAFLTSGDKNG